MVLPLPLLSEHKGFQDLLDGKVWANVELLMIIIIIHGNNVHLGDYECCEVKFYDHPKRDKGGFMMITSFATPLK